MKTMLAGLRMRYGNAAVRLAITEVDHIAHLPAYFASGRHLPQA